MKRVTIATGDIFVTDNILKQRIKKEFKADAVDMESAAIAQAAKMNNVPVIVIRTISDGLNENTSKYKQNKQTISKIPAKITIAVLKADK